MPLDTNAWFVPDGFYLGYNGGFDAPQGGVSNSQVTLAAGLLNMRATYGSFVFPGGPGENGPATLPLNVGAIIWKKMQMLYGTVEVRAKLTGLSTHPVIFMLGTTSQETIYTWEPTGSNYPGFSEIDFPEGKPGVYSNTTTLEFNNGNPTDGYSTHAVTGFTDYSTNFHVYKIVWAPGSLTFYVDGVQVRTTTVGVPSEKMFLVVDIETNPAASGVASSGDFPQTYQVDYVRAWDQNNNLIFQDNFDGSPAFQDLSQSNLTFIQGAGGSLGGTDTLPVDYPFDTRGYTYLLALAAFHGTTGSATLTDTLGNIWLPIGAPFVSAGLTLQMFHVPVNNSIGGTTTVTLKAPVSNVFNSLGIFEFANQADVPLDVISDWVAGIVTSVVTPSIATNFSNETLICLAVGGDNVHAMAAGSGYILRLDGTSDGQNFAEDSAQAKIGTYNATFTQPLANYWAALLAVKSIASSTPSVSGGPTIGSIYPGGYPGANLAAAFSNPQGLDLIQVIAEGQGVVWNLTAAGVANFNPANPTPNALLGKFSGQSFATAFPNPAKQDILQIITSGNHVVFFVDYTGFAHFN